MLSDDARMAEEESVERLKGEGELLCRASKNQRVQTSSPRGRSYRSTGQCLPICAVTASLVTIAILVTLGTSGKPASSPRQVPRDLRPLEPPHLKRSNRPLLPTAGHLASSSSKRPTAASGVQGPLARFGRKGVRISAPRKLLSRSVDAGCVLFPSYSLALTFTARHMVVWTSRRAAVRTQGDWRSHSPTQVRTTSLRDVERRQPIAVTSLIRRSSL